MITRSLLFAGMILALGTLVTVGCGKSPDDLYNEAKELSTHQETIDEGITALAQFENRFPDDPRVPEVLLSRAALLQATGDYESAVATYEKLCEKYPGTPEEYKSQFLLGYLYYEDLDNPDKAKQIFQSFITAYPDSELTVSARVLVDNIDRPVEDWAVIKEIDDTAAMTGEDH